MITVTTVRYQGDALTDTFSANMEHCNQYNQYIQELLQVYKTIPYTIPAILSLPHFTILHYF